MGLGWPVDPVSTRGLSLGPRLPQLVGSQGPCPHEHPQTRAERPAWKVTLLPVLCGSKQSHAHLDPGQEATGPIPGRQTKSRGHHFINCQYQEPRGGGTEACAGRPQPRTLGPCPLTPTARKGRERPGSQRCRLDSEHTVTGSCSVLPRGSQALHKAGQAFANSSASGIRTSVPPVALPASQAAAQILGRTESVP